jgi:hypothetical protein
MSQPEVFCRWSSTISNRFPHLSQPQARVLALYSLGLPRAEHCALAVLGKPDTVERRLQRFLSNPRIDWAVSCPSLGDLGVGSLQRPPRGAAAVGGWSARGVSGIGDPAPGGRALSRCGRSKKPTGNDAGRWRIGNVHMNNRTCC